MNDDLSGKLGYNYRELDDMLDTYRAAQDNPNAKPAWWADFHSAFSMLKPLDREILQFVLAGRNRRGTLTFAASKLGIAPATARKRLQRAKSRLLWALNRHVRFVDTVMGYGGRRPRRL